LDYIYIKFFNDFLRQLVFRQTFSVVRSLEQSAEQRVGHTVIKSALRHDRSVKSVNRYQPVSSSLKPWQKIANGFRSSSLERAEPAMLLQETLLP